MNLYKFRQIYSFYTCKICLSNRWLTDTDVAPLGLCIEEGRLFYTDTEETPQQKPPLGLCIEGATFLHRY